MSASSSSPASSEWVQFYRQHNNNQQLSEQVAPPSAGMFSSHEQRVSDATVVTTTHVVTSPTTSSPRAGGASHEQLNPEGRVTKPVRRRTRASRRTPTTLLNTDTTNFRAMVQQFTGGPNAPFATAASGPPHATSFNFGLGTRQQIIVNPQHLMVNPAAASPSGYHHHHHHLQFQQAQQPQQQYMFSLGNSSSTTHAHGHGDSSFHHDQRLLGNLSRPPHMEVSNHGFVMEAGISSHAPTRPSSSNDNTNNHNYMF